MKRSPLQRKTPMRRATARLIAEREARLKPAKRVFSLPKPTVVLRAVRMAGNLAAEAPVSAAKEDAVRSERYRRLVATMPCIACGLVGRSQHAHVNVGKGAGIKADDRFAFPLCADAPQAFGCHTLHDQGGRLPQAVRRRREAQWALQTIGHHQAAGTWPAGLPLPDVTDLERWAA